MFTLVAASRKPILDGIVATKTFPSLSEAEETMRKWARYGIENQCNEADAIYICDKNSNLVRVWDRARKQSVAPK